MDKFEILDNLLNINTAGDEKNKVIIKYIKNYLDKLGFNTHIMEDNYTKKQNLVAHIGGANDELGFVCHTDTIDQSGKWAVDPYKLTVREDMLIGLGISDMKGGIAALLSALGEINCKSLTKGLTLCFTYDEEMGFAGIENLVEEIVLPKKIILPYPTDLKPVISTKGCIEYNIIMNGKSTHTATPDMGENAIEKSLLLISELKEFATALAKTKNVIFDIPNSTFNISKIVGGTSINQVAGDCSIFFDFRTINREQHKIIEDKIKDLSLKYECFTTTINNVMPMITENDEFKDILEKITERTSTAFAYVTEGSFIKNSYPIILGPGPMNSGNANEYISKFSFESCIRIYKTLITALCR